MITILFPRLALDPQLCDNLIWFNQFICSADGGIVHYFIVDHFLNPIFSSNAS